MCGVDLEKNIGENSTYWPGLVFDWANEKINSHLVIDRIKAFFSGWVPQKNE